jgi:C1A family cysteine protease
MDLSYLTGQRLPLEAKPETLPSQFDWRDTSKVTPVKDQGACGSCYSFAAIGNWESNLLIAGTGTFDLSENNAKECNWEEVNNYQYPHAGDYRGSCDGGNYYMLANLFSQKGTALESCDPYQDSDVDCNSTCAYQKTLVDWDIISGDAVADTQVLKQYIYDNGPVYTMIYADSASGFDAWYDGSYTLDYTWPAGQINHAVLIVGWSNNLPAISGDTGPADGWIVKNSWGTGWGAAGYFYITYGAANIGTASSLIHEWQDYDSDGQIWYYDEAGWYSSWGCNDPTAWGLARFIPPSNASVGRVEFWTTDATTDVDVYLYDEFDGSTPSNLLASKLNNSFGEAGYHSVALDSPLPVTSGDDVIAVVKFTNASYGYPVTADTVGTSTTGRTYLSCSGSSWTDMGTSYDADLGIRLRTGGAVAPAPEATSITPNSGTNNGVVHITNVAGSNFQTGAIVKLTKTGQPDINGDNTQVVNASSITCDLNLNGAATGSWDVVVTNPDLQSATLSGGFTVNAPPGERKHLYLPLVTRSYGGLTNGDFEAGSTGWIEYSSHGWPLILNSGFPGTMSPHSGSWAAWLGGDENEIAYIQQQVAIPVNKPYLHYWHWIGSDDSCGYDLASVRVNGTSVATYDLCSSSNTGGWVEQVVNLGAYAGQSVTLQLYVQTDSSLNSNLFFDDASLQASAVSLAGGFPAIDNQAAAPRSGRGDLKEPNQ